MKIVSSSNHKSAKYRKKELEMLQKELQQAQCADYTVPEILPHSLCKCSFFQDSELQRIITDVHENEIDQLLVRQFLRTVNRWGHTKDHKKNMWTIVHDSDEEKQIFVSCEFLAELVGKLQAGANAEYLATFAHQAVSFIEETCNHICKEKKHNTIIPNRIISRLASHLLKKMLESTCERNVEESSTDVRSWVLQILSKLGTVPFIGQRVLILASEQIVFVSEALIAMDPFDNNASQLHDNMVIVLQLIENLISYHSSSWENNDSFDGRLLEEWVHHFIKMKRTSAIYGQWNSLVPAYIERIAGHVVAHIHRLSNVEKMQGHCHKAFLKFVQSDSNLKS